MADIVSPEKRSLMMAGIRGKDTVPELIIRKGLHAQGFRFRIHDSKLPGNPDIVLPKFKAAIFIHGCFWHGHNCHLFKWPVSRQEFWKKKIKRNIEKDREVLSALHEQGWRTFIVWECSLKGKTRLTLDKVLNKIAAWTRGKNIKEEIRGMDADKSA